MSSITIKNPSVSDNIRTSLSQEVSSGTTLYVDSSVNFSSGNYIVIGEPGLENTEVVSLTAAPPTNTSLTCSAVKFSHPRGTPIYYCLWDKYSLVYRTSSTGTWTAYAGMPLDLTYDSIYTEYRDSSATSSYQWKYRYYSTEKTAYSDYSDTISATGWAKNSVGYMVRQVRKIINDPDSQTVKDAEIIRFFNAAQDKIYTLYNRWWFLLKSGTAIPTVASTKYYSLPSDFGRMSNVSYRYVSGSSDVSYNLKYLPKIEYEYESRDNNASEDDNLKYYSIYPGDSTNTTGYLYVWPVPDAGALNMTPWYYKTMTDLDSYADTTEVPIPSILEDYALAQIFKIRSQESQAEYYDKLFREQIELLKLMQQKQVGGPRYLWKYAGRDPDRRLYGSSSIYSDAEREASW